MTRSTHDTPTQKQRDQHTFSHRAEDLTPDEANDVRTNLAYDLQGAKFDLPADFEATKDELPEWRLAHFAVIVPLPVGAFDGADFTRWAPGRFRGIKSIQVPAFDEARGTYRNPETMEREQKLDQPAWRYSPRVFHRGANVHFRSPLNESMGADALDAKGGASEFAPSRNRHGMSVSARRFLFQPDITPENGKEPPADPRQAPVDSSFSLIDATNPLASVTLTCAELLDYQGPELKYADTANQPDTPDTPDTLDTDAREFRNQFLVLHVVAEHCSGDALEAVSKSLHRPRSKVKVGRPGEEPRTRNLLEVCFDRVNEVLGGAQLQVSRGGTAYVKGDRRRPLATRPYTTITAIPACDEPALPRRMRSSLREGLGTWTRHDAWAWFLATRADDYSPELTAMDQVSLDASRVQLFQDWTVHSDENGLAVVRRSPIENRNNNFWMLTGTRLVDLAILVRRADNYLSVMAKQMRRMSFGSEELEAVRRKPEWDDEDVELASKILRTSLRDFEDIQTEFVIFRDYLWYESVSGRPVDTAVLHHMLKETGTRDDFHEVASELELRKDIYKTQGDAIRVALDNVKRRRAERAQDRREQLNINLAIVGTALAIPGLIDLWPRDDSSYGAFVISVILVLTITAFLLSPKLRGVFRPNQNSNQNSKYNSHANHKAAAHVDKHQS
ncbi:hypothetical protein [Corynebacterium hadale]|uniref:hypothetical protein n=1 Tax=Corynebacterium hadale TaxID=2026255 RepID=UPI000BAA690E|nr:hypothetical protein [Corynebacterium hadale]PAT12445.1 hypothetical protein CKJ83_06720 [Corynebacterium hadale]